ncbi:hypothetical protein TWF730_007401 [Orbilia blumenaviensis]|uniref:Uncharacterized protein n=1 Tax=Orbilia blumenaviensis TaxID=1796055 RepID=A0AAV9V7Y9_9PEZI
MSFWLEMAYGKTFEEGGLFQNAKGENMPKYESLGSLIEYMSKPPTDGKQFNAPHGKCRVLYCNGANFGISLCSRRKGGDKEVSLDGRSIASIVGEWMEEFKWQRALPREKSDGSFKTPNYGRSYWSEDPAWSVNFEECGNNFVGFGSDVLHDT